MKTGFGHVINIRCAVINSCMHANSSIFKIEDHRQAQKSQYFQEWMRYNQVMLNNGRTTLALVWTTGLLIWADEILSVQECNNKIQMPTSWVVLVMLSDNGCARKYIRAVGVAQLKTREDPVRLQGEDHLMPAAR